MVDVGDGCWGLWIVIGRLCYCVWCRRVVKCRIGLFYVGIGVVCLVYIVIEKVVYV